MNNRLRISVILSGMVIVALVFAFPLWRPFFARTVVNDVFPGLNAEQQGVFLQFSDEQQKIFNDLRKANATSAVAFAQAATSPDIVIPTEQQGMPAISNLTVLAGGNFTQIDAVRLATGSATIYQLPDNSRLLRLENFKATNAPELHIYLTRSSKPVETKDLGNDYIDLGLLQGNVGSQNYTVPTEVNLSDYRGVVIYSVPVGLIVSTAELRLS